MPISAYKRQMPISAIGSLRVRSSFSMRSRRRATMRAASGAAAGRAATVGESVMSEVLYACFEEFELPQQAVCVVHTGLERGSVG